MADLPINSSNSDMFNPNGSNGNNALKEMAVSGDIKDKKDKKFGEKIVLQVEQIVNSTYFMERNKRFQTNRDWAAGKTNVETLFSDKFDMVNGKVNYIVLAWKCIMIFNTTISRLVGRWMTKKEKATVTATDPISIKQKKEQYDQAEFVMDYKPQLEALQATSGTQLISKDQFIPDDKDHLDLWAKEEAQLPEEIKMELGINTIFDEFGWGNDGDTIRVVKHDSAEVGLICGEAYADTNGKIIINKLMPENCFYSYSERDDFEDAELKGVIESWTIGEIRNKYPNLSADEIKEISKSAKQWQYTDKIRFDSNTWNSGSYMAIDDWTVDVLRFTLKSLDNDKNLIKTAKDGSLYVDKPKKRIDEVYPGNEYVENQIENSYYGVSIRGSKTLLEWGLDKNMIRPQSYENINKVYSRFCFHMFQNRKMRNLAVPEKIEEPAMMMILTRLKIQQFIAKMAPSGWIYDIDGLQNIDLGNGNASPIELMRVTNQTGDVFYRSKDAEGNRLEKPITQAPNSAGASKLQELIETYNFHQEVLRGEIGINEYAEGQSIKPRTGVQNVQTSMEVSYNATDYMNDSTVSLKKQLARNISCLLHDAVEYGSMEYRKLMKEEDVKRRDFSVNIEMLPDTDEITELMARVDAYVTQHPDFILYLSPLKIKEIAKRNVKLAAKYFEISQRKAIDGALKQAKEQSQMNADIQAKAGIQVEKEKQNTLAQELKTKSQVEMAISGEKQKEALVNMFGGIYSKGLPVPADLKKLEAELIQNVFLPIISQNKVSEQVIANADKGETTEGEQPEGQPQPEMPEQPI